MNRQTLALRGLALAGAAAGLLTAFPAQAQTSDNGFTCRAETLDVSFFKQPPLQPFVAGSTTEPCADDVGGLSAAGESLVPSAIGLDAAYAITRLREPGRAPANQIAEASSGVADARIDPQGNILRVQGVQADSTASCVNGSVQYKSTGLVAKLFVFGQEIPLNDGLSQVITGLDGVTQFVVHIELNEETNDANGYTFRAVHVTVPMDGSVLDAGIGVNRLAPRGRPCSDFTGGGPGSPPQRPRVGFPFGGGNVVDLKDIKGFKGFQKRGKCVNSRSFGRRIAIVGDNKRNRLTGSKFPDRIFAFGARDIVNGGGARDCLEAGSGRDAVSGGTGADVAYGRRGNDGLDGGPGNDLLYGGPGSDRVFSGAGRDVLYGGPGADRIATRAGGDRIFAGAGNDRVFAARLGKSDKVRCGKGRDVVRVDPMDRVSGDCEVVLVQQGLRRR